MHEYDPIVRWAVEHTPPSVIRQLKRIYWQLLQQPDVKVLALEDVYGQVERQNHVASRLVPLPEAVSLPMAPFAPRLRNGRYKVPDDYVTVLKDVLYCPINDVVMTEAGQIIAESLCAAINVKPFPRRETTLSGYCTPWRTPKNNYYHTLLDNLPRLISLADFAAGLETPIRLLYSGELSEAESFFLAKFCPQNIVLERLQPDALYRAEHLILTPFKTRRYAGYLPERYALQIRSRLLPKRPSARAHRLLISRVNSTRRHILNLDRLSAALGARGFETVELENLPLETQIELFYDAEVVVAAHGAGLSNILFGEDLQVVELFPCPHIVPHYFYLSQSLGHRYTFWCGQEASHHENFEVDVNEVLALLDGAGMKIDSASTLPLVSNPVQNEQSGVG